MDEKLCGKFHINYVSVKVSKIVGIIAKARHYLGLKNLKEYYYTLPMMGYPYLTYIVTLTGQAHIQLD